MTLWHTTPIDPNRNSGPWLIKRKRITYSANTTSVMITGHCDK